MTVTEPSVQTKKKPGRKPKASAPPQSPVMPVGSTDVNDGDSIEQRRARLLAELAEINAAAPQSSTPLGPNYWAMNHSTLKTLCVSKSIVDRTGTKEGMISLMQNEDMKLGLAPHPKENTTAMTGLRAGNTPVHVEPHTRDAVRIIDSDGNEYAIVKRIGRMINGQPVLLDMAGNARMIAAALNEGRLA